jgi:hypothetical protein
MEDYSIDCSGLEQENFYGSDNRAAGPGVGVWRIALVGERVFGEVEKTKPISGEVLFY